MPARHRKELTEYHKGYLDPDIFPRDGEPTKAYKQPTANETPSLGSGLDLSGIGGEGDEWSMEDIRRGAKCFPMHHWSDPAMPMDIGRIEMGQVGQTASDLTGRADDLGPPGPQLMRNLKFAYLRIGVEDGSGEASGRDD